MHTRAAVELDGPRAVLRATGEALSAQVLEPRGAVFEVTGAKGTAAGEAQQPGVRKLIVRLAAGAGATRLAVEFAPGEKPAAPTRPGPKSPALEPLARWPGRRR
jgi:hypothetical protein